MYFSGLPKLTIFQERCLDSLTEDEATLLPHICTSNTDDDLIFCCLLNTVEPEYYQVAKGLAKCIRYHKVSLYQGTLPHVLLLLG